MATAEKQGRELLASAGVTVGGSEAHDIQVHDGRFWARVLKDRELGLGEAYQDGWWDVERVDEFLVRVFTADLRAAVRPSPALLWNAARARLTNRQTNSRAAQNASAHYDIGNDLYVRMLGEEMIYSCAVWDEALDLAAAQEAKLDLICRKLHLEPGMRVLDIGCGWGGFARHAAAGYGVHVVGISPAGEQVREARQRAGDLSVEFHQQDYRDVTGTYDRIVSIGMFEHVGPRNYPGFFDRCGDLLTPDGLMLHHTIGSNESKESTDAWFDRYIFPGGVIPSLHQIAGAAQPRWSIEDVHNLGPDYDRTLMTWFERIEARWDEIPEYDDRFRRTWRYYLLSSAASFRVRNLQLFQVVFSRTGRVSPTYRGVR
ncbi:MAG: cyclopropane fatty acyl phospholipid synthase [Acidimicrobiia bacterium]|nr:cyclopropane fatty acyl phospholipid synthase [Actinomycetota bacterium]MBL6925552.1 cyclopropane fatty acyl phospholipid synthase [Acidimicrobiia bacterium]MBL6926694.1 cyclopropane fatty acyl phospholipid synthase [Acidimicrobiia bacterium]